MYLNSSFRCSDIGDNYWNTPSEKSSDVSNANMNQYRSFRIADILLQSTYPLPIPQNSGQYSAFLSYVEKQRKDNVDSYTISRDSTPLQALRETSTDKFINFIRNGERNKICDISSGLKSHTTGELKFGIQRILSSEFGKDTGTETQPKESIDQQPRHRTICSCNAPSCPYTGYIHVSSTSPGLSAFKTIQTPQYPLGSGTDALPGPYSVLNNEHQINNQPKRKRSWSRAVFSNLQRKGLEKRFQVQKYVTKPDRRQLAAMLGLTDAQVKVWFQNRRMKWRQSQKSCDAEGEGHSSDIEADHDENESTDKTDDMDVENVDVEDCDSDDSDDHVVRGDHVAEEQLGSEHSVTKQTNS